MKNKLHSRYSRVAIVMHWVMAILIICMVGFGWSLDDLEGSELSQSLSYHATGGIMIASLLVLRLLWRIGNPPPALPETLSKAQRIASQCIHWTLYALMLLVPMTGFVAATAHDLPVVILGSLDLQSAFSFLGHDDFTIKKEIHAQAMHILLALIIGHIGAALVHKFWFKDNIMARMLP